VARWRVTASSAVGASWVGETDAPSAAAALGKIARALGYQNAASLVERLRGVRVEHLAINPSAQAQQRAEVARGRRAQDRDFRARKEREWIAPDVAALEQARTRARAAKRAARDACKRERRELREPAAQVRQAARLQAERAIAAMRDRAAATCAVRKDRAATVGGALVAKRQARLRAAKAEARRVMRPGAKAKRSTAKERRAESDDDVRINIDPELVPIFDRVRRTIKGSAHRSRTEAFLEWVHDHPDQVLAMQAAAADAWVAREARKQHAPRKARAASALSDDDLIAI